MRISDAAALLPLAFLATCQQPKTDTKVLAKVEAEQRSQAADGGRINCALANAATFARVCDVDREEGPRGLILTVRHPDGGFRRLLVSGDGRGVVAADGAERAKVAIVSPDEIEVAVGNDRYRLPATVKAGASAAR